MSVSVAMAVSASLLLLASCTSMEGDLGRPAKNTTTEAIMQQAGKLRAKLNGELYSDFNMTDEEKVMRNKAWILIRPPHAQDWISADLRSARYVGLHVLTEAQWHRLAPVVDTAYDPKQYYKALRAARYASHHVRYERVTTDINQDREAFAAFIPTGERVVKMDEARMAALGRLADMDPRQLEDAYARVDENERFIGWVWRALQYRMRAYAYAIKRLEVETPSPRVLEANKALKRLYAEFQEQNGGLGDSATKERSSQVRSSRYTRKQWAVDNPNLIK